METDMERDCIQVETTAAWLSMAACGSGTDVFCFALFFNDLHDVIKAINKVRMILNVAVLLTAAREGIAPNAFG